jgi:hypothetical protein
MWRTFVQGPPSPFDRLRVRATDGLVESLILSLSKEEAFGLRLGEQRS